MAATFPGSTRPFNPRVDLRDTVVADNVNSLYEEVVAIENTIGTNATAYKPLTSTYDGTFSLTTTWNTISERLNNIEAGLVTGVPTGPYFKKTGGTVSPASGSVGLVLKTTAGSSNLLEARDSSNTLAFTLDSSGLPSVNGNSVIYVNGTAYNNLISYINSSITTAIENISSLSPFLLSGL